MPQKGVILELNDHGIRGVSYSPEFMQGMLNRVAVSYHKYGPADKAETDWIPTLEERITRYKMTGNTEWLIDVANYAMLEYLYPRHPDAHFRATDSSESPGHTMLDGSHNDGFNKPDDRAREAYRREGD